MGNDLGTTMAEPDTGLGTTHTPQQSQDLAGTQRGGMPRETGAGAQEEDDRETRARRRRGEGRTAKKPGKQRGRTSASPNLKSVVCTAVVWWGMLLMCWPWYLRAEEVVAAETVTRGWDGKSPTTPTSRPQERQLETAEEGGSIPTDLGGGKGLTIGNTPAAGKGKARKKGGTAWGAPTAEASPLQALATMFSNIAQQPPQSMAPPAWGPQAQQQWGAQWQAPMPWGGWPGAQPMYSQGPTPQGGAATIPGAPPANQHMPQQGQYHPQPHPLQGEIVGQPGQPFQGQQQQKGEPEQDDQAAYKKWQNMREAEIAAEQAALNGGPTGVEMRWGAREQRTGKVRLWLPEEAIRMGPAGPELKDPHEVYGKYVFDWAAVLNGPTARQLAEATKDTTDTTAYRVQAVSMSPEAARTAERYECIVSLQATTNQKEKLQQLLGRMDLREMRETEFRTLERALHGWAEQHGRPVQFEIPDVSKQVQAMTKMLQELGLTEKEIQRRMKETITGKGNAKPQPDQTQDTRMVASSASSTELNEDHGEAEETVPWAPPEGGRTYMDAQGSAPTKWEAESVRTHDTYLDGISIGDAQMDDSDDGVRPMTHSELSEIWGTKDREGPQKWKKGLGKEIDRPGEWDVYNAETQRPMSSKVHETRAQKRAEKSRGEPVDARKTAAKQTKPTKASSANDKERNQQPPRGGRRT